MTAPANQFDLSRYIPQNTGIPNPKTQFNSVAALLRWVIVSVAFLAVATLGTAQNPPQLQISSPANGSIFNPGQTLTVTVTSPTPASFSQVFVSSDLTGFLGAISPLPGQLSLTIPSSGFTLGTHRFSAQGTPTSGGALASAQVAIDVERPDFPSNIWSTLPGLQIDAPGEQSRLVLYADFKDGTTWRMSASTYVTFQSSNTAVATVDSAGLVTAVGAGSGFITGAYAVGGNTLQVLIPVNVAGAPGAGGGNTTNFVISATPSTESVTPGQSASFAVAVISFNGFAGSVTLSAGALPNGITASFTPNVVTVPGSSTVNFSIPSSAPFGTSAITIAGNSGSLTEDLSVLVTVSATAGAPAITTLNPSSGPIGTSVTIAGVNFGSTQGTSTVSFNGTTATPTNWTATSIVAPVPDGATSGNVLVTVGGVASNGVTFTVQTTPNIASLSPNSGALGTSVTITGTSFGSTQGTSTVTFNGTTATPTSWSATSIVAPVPSGATTGNVVVNVGGTSSNGVNFTVNSGSGSSLMLGVNSIGSVTDNNISGQAEAFPATAVTTGTLSSLTIFIDSGNTATQLTAGLYTDNAGHPGMLLTQGTSSSLTPGAWTTVNVPPSNIASGITYWITILGTGGQLNFRDGHLSGCSSETSSQTTLTSLPASWTTGARWTSCPLSGYGSGTPIATLLGTASLQTVSDRHLTPYNCAVRFAAHPCGPFNPPSGRSTPIFDHSMENT